MVYGLADHSKSVGFLAELHDKITREVHPVVVGGDFNLMRTMDDKNKYLHLVNLQLLDTFNNWIADVELQELDRVGASYIWTDPTQCVLDRVFVSPEWEHKFPSCSLAAMTRLGSDHCPLVLDSEEARAKRRARFYFELQWLEHPGFGDVVRDCWQRGVLPTSSPARSFS